MKVLIAFKNPAVDNPSACHAGLGVTARNISDVLCEHGYDAQAVAVTDGYYIRDSLRANKWPGITHLIMCAPFFDSPFLTGLVAEFPTVTFAVTFHSNIGFLGVDNWSQRVLAEQMEISRKYINFSVAGNCEKFVRTVTQAFEWPAIFLPNLYFLHGPIERKRSPWSLGQTLRIGAFGATRVLKNLPTAAWAAILIHKALKSTSTEFWISRGREEGPGAGKVSDGINKLVANFPNIRVVEASWAPWLQFRHDTVRKMNLMLQPSFTESFNGVTADGVAEGIPSVVGEAIDWVPSDWIANADDANVIAETGARLIKNKNAARDGYRALSRHNDLAMIAWRKYLGSK